MRLTKKSKARITDFTLWLVIVVTTTLFFITFIESLS